jgi:hypothetical protein
MQIRTTLNLAVAVGFAVTLALSVPPRLSAGEPRGEAEVTDADSFSTSHAECSDRTLRGDYAFAIDGTILTAPGPLLVRGVAMTHFDGHGNLSQVDFVTLNGVAGGPDWRPATGTYEINADCTGTAQILPAGLLR